MLSWVFAHDFREDVVAGSSRRRDFGAHQFAGTK